MICRVAALTLIQKSHRENPFNERIPPVRANLDQRAHRGHCEDMTTPFALYDLSLSLLGDFQDRMTFPLRHRDAVVEDTVIDGLVWQAACTDGGLRFLYHEGGCPELPVILFLHGNGSSTAWGASSMAYLAGQGFTVVCAEYPGYSGNPGVPSEESLQEGASQAELWARDKWPDRLLAVLGESIGTAPALWLAARGRADLLVLDSPMTSLHEVVYGAFAWMSPSMRNPMNARALILSARAERTLPPTLILVSAYDPVVPERMGAELAGMIPGAELVRSHQPGHTALAVDGGRGFAGTRLLAWLRSRAVGMEQGE